MQKLFSSSLFGYSGKSVHDDISSMNEESSRKRLTKEGEHKVSLEAMQAEIDQLRATFQAMDEEMEQYSTACQTLWAESGEAGDLSVGIALEEKTAV